MTAVAIPHAGGLDVAMAPVLELVEAAIGAIEDRPFHDRQHDARIYRALGWQVKQGHPTRVLMCRSPAATTWRMLPFPTLREDEAAKVVPFRWSRGAGVRNGLPFAWTALDWPVREGVPFFECSGTSVPIALCKAALFAHRWRALRALGAA